MPYAQSPGSLRKRGAPGGRGEVFGEPYHGIANRGKAVKGARLEKALKNLDPMTIRSLFSRRGNRLTELGTLTKASNRG